LDASPAALVSMVDVDRQLAGQLAVQGEKARATTFAREGVDFAERRLRQAPQDAAARELLAKATFNLAASVGGEASIAHWRRAGELFEAGLAEKPEDPDRQRNVALVEKYLGAVFDNLDRDNEALPHYRRALELDEKRFARYPTQRMVRFDVAIDLANVATMLEKDYKLDAAYEMFSRSLELRQELWNSDPKDALAKGRVGLVHARLATIDAKRGRYPSALAHAREAVRIQESVSATTKDLASRRELAQALYILGRAEAATGMQAAACASVQRSSHLFETLPASRSDSTYPEVAAKAAAACKAGRPIDGR
jgi:tetratricopeptide (TPR) repeat protein